MEDIDEFRSFLKKHTVNIPPPKCDLCGSPIRALPLLHGEEYVLPCKECEIISKEKMEDICE